MDNKPYEYDPHRFHSSRILGKAYCVKCGFISLNNPFSAWATRMGCDNEKHPSYKRQRKLVRKKGE